MKKLVMMLLCLAVCAPGFGFPLNGYGDKSDYFIFRGTLSRQQILDTIKTGGGFLPLYVTPEWSYLRSDGKVGGKVKAAREAYTKAYNEKSYRAYYNAAVVWATKPDFQGYDNIYPLDPKAQICIDPNRKSTCNNVVSTAIGFAKAAIAIKPNEPYMYLLKGQVEYEQGVTYYPGNGTFRVTNEAMAREAWKDFEMARSKNWNVAPYCDMANLARALGKKSAARTYQNACNHPGTYAQVDEEDGEGFEGDYAQTDVESEAAQREVQVSLGGAARGVNLL